MAEITEERLSEIEARAELATPGPWSFVSEGKTEFVLRPIPNDHIRWVQMGNQQRKPDNLIFIAHARTDMPDLCAALRAAEAREERLRAACEAANAKCHEWYDRMFAAGLVSPFVDELFELGGLLEKALGGNHE